MKANAAVLPFFLYRDIDVLVKQTLRLSWKRGRLISPTFYKQSHPKRNFLSFLLALVYPKTHTRIKRRNMEPTIPVVFSPHHHYVHFPRCNNNTVPALFHFTSRNVFTCSLRKPACCAVSTEIIIFLLRCSLKS